MASESRARIVGPTSAERKILIRELDASGQCPSLFHEQEEIPHDVTEASPFPFSGPVRAPVLARYSC